MCCFESVTVFVRTVHCLTVLAGKIRTVCYWTTAMTQPVARLGGAALSFGDSEKWENGTKGDTLMNRWGNYYFFFLFIFFVHSISPWPAMASQVCAISQCQHLSVRLIQLRLRQLQRARVTGVSLTGFVPFVFVFFVFFFSAQVTALPAIYVR